MSGMTHDSHLSQAPCCWYLPRTISKNCSFENTKSKHYFCTKTIKNQYICCVYCAIFSYIFQKIIHTAHGSWSFYPWVTTANKNVTDWHEKESQPGIWNNHPVVISHTIHGTGILTYIYHIVPLKTTKCRSIYHTLDGIRVWLFFFEVDDESSIWHVNCFEITISVH